MPFPALIREEALVKSGRRCCVCHDFSGRAVNVHHIVQEADGGPNTLENAIVLCLRCHSEAGHFNPRHPIGTKYAPSELVKHRNQWWAAVASGRAVQSNSAVAVSWKRTFLSSELHTQRLLVTLRNGQDESIEHWKLKILLPSSVPVRLHGVSPIGEERNAEGRYKVFELSGGSVYPGEEVTLLGMQPPFLEYDMNSDAYYETRDNPWQIKWHVYLASSQPIAGSKPWTEMHQY